MIFHADWAFGGSSNEVVVREVGDVIRTQREVSDAPM